MATEHRTRADAHGHDGGHHHRDVSGGWLRPAVFGAMDGLVTNVSLIAGWARRRIGPYDHPHRAGRAGRAGRGRQLDGRRGVRVRLSQNELIYAEVNKERLELQNNAVAEQAELATMLRACGISPATARRRRRDLGAS